MATLNWVGTAVAVKDVWTITVANTWATSDTATVRINGLDLVVTIGSLVTTAQVATTIKQAFESETFTDTTASRLPSGGGTSIPEMSQITATVSGSTVILTADTAGVQHTISVTETTAGSGSLSITNTTVATGPNYWDNVDNWDTGALPANSDDVYIDRPVSIFSGLNQSAVTLTSLTIGPNFGTSTIGLPSRNSVGYEEYREEYLRISATSVSVRCSSGRIRLNVGSAQTTCTVFSTGATATTNLGAFQFLGSHASNTLRVIGGDVSVAGTEGETAVAATVTQTGGTLSCGTGVTLTNVNKTSGTFSAASSTTTLRTLDGTTSVRAGTHAAVTVGGGSFSAIGATTITALFQSSGESTIGPNCTVTTINKAAGTLTCDVGCTTLTSDSGTTSIRSGSVTTANVGPGSTLNYGGTGTIGTLNTASDAAIPAVSFDNGTSDSCTVTTLSVSGRLSITDTAKRATFTNGLPQTVRSATISV
jgi:hypothetical protein